LFCTFHLFHACSWPTHLILLDLTTAPYIWGLYTLILWTRASKIRGRHVNPLPLRSILKVHTITLF
jgi:hypothetical protein